MCKFREMFGTVDIFQSKQLFNYTLMYTVETVESFKAITMCFKKPNYFFPRSLMIIHTSVNVRNEGETSRAWNCLNAILTLASSERDLICGCYLHIQISEYRGNRKMRAHTFGLMCWYFPEAASHCPPIRPH